MLESAGYTVELAASAEEGLAMAVRKPYALVLVDVEMPGMNGFEFIEQTRARPELRHLPCILVTSRASAEDRQRGLAAALGRTSTSANSIRAPCWTGSPTYWAVEMPQYAGRSIRVLVVEDSARLRARIVDTLNADPGIEVVAQAADGRSAIDRCLELRPDIVTMDVILPVINGLAVTEQLMQRCPTPILIISAATDTGELVNTFAALAAGAVDVLEKPRSATVEDQDWDRRLLSTVKLVARIQVITHLGKSTHQAASPAKSTTSAPVSAAVPPAPRTEMVRLREVRPETVRPETARPEFVQPETARPEGSEFSVLAIGASTGGPAAVATVLSSLPTGFSPPVLLVLHVSEHFGPAIANWLRDVTGRRVRLAQHGELMASLSGQVVMAPPGWHLAVHKGALMLNQEPERHSCRPSVDVLFESLARDCGPRAAACLLTGMGKDGASGLLDVHHGGGLTVAQDEPPAWFRHAGRGGPAGCGPACSAGGPDRPMLGRSAVSGVKPR